MGMPMRMLGVVCVAGMSALVLGQSGVMVTRDAGSGVPGIRGALRVEPASNAPWAQSFTGEWHTRATADSIYLYQRYLIDDDRHIFLGYDLTLEPQPQADTFRVSFYELGIGVAELPMVAGKRRAEEGDWKRLLLAKYPSPQIVHTGDTISVELWTASDTGQKIVDEVHLYPPVGLTLNPPSLQLQAQITRIQSQLGQLSARGALARGAPEIPTVEGPARNFSAADAEMQLVSPRVIFDGAPVGATAPGVLTEAKGALVWFHLPGHGRYVLSLTPRPELGFVKAGELRGGTVSFSLESNSIKLESGVAVAPGDAAYTLYVLHDPDWEPTAQSQRGRFQAGSVSAREIELLRKK